jgi:hypothetical protein
MPALCSCRSKMTLAWPWWLHWDDKSSINSLQAFLVLSRILLVSCSRCLVTSPPFGSFNQPSLWSQRKLHLSQYYTWLHIQYYHIADRSREFLCLHFKHWGPITRILVFNTFYLYTRYSALKSHRGQFTEQLFSHMFTQVLGIMTSLVITSRSKDRPLVLLHSQAIFSHSTEDHTSSWVASIVLSLSKIISQGRCDSSRIIIWQFIWWSWGYFYDSESDSDDSMRKKNCAPKTKLRWKSNKL